MQYRGFILILAHALVFAFLIPLAYLLRFDGVMPDEEVRQAFQIFPLILLIKLAAFVALGSHRGWWRYATFADLVTLGEAATLSALSITIANEFIGQMGGGYIPRSIILLDWAETILILGGLRCSTRLFHERYQPMITVRDQQRSLVVGASEASAALVHELHGRSKLGIRVVGFLDSDPKLKRRILAGIKVLGVPDDMRWLVARHNIQTVLIPTPTVPADQVRALVMRCNKAGVKAQIVPGVDSLLTGALTIQPRDVDIEDLLYRDPVKLDNEAIGRFLRGRVVLVTGAAGSIGSDLCRQVLQFGPTKLILLDHSENGLFFIERELRGLAQETEVIAQVASIRDGQRLRSIFDRYLPAVVFHAAAHKHVPMMEANPGEAVKNNIFGTRTLVDEAVRAGIEAFVMISTDKAVNPTSVMGVCKRLSEMYVQAISSQVETRLVTVRFGNVLGSNGSVLPVFKEQIRQGGPVTVTHPDVTRYFMTIPEATQLVLQAGTLGLGGEIFVLDMGQPIKVVDLARDLIRFSGLEEGREIELVFTGLRPGEKLYEELYDARECRLPTPHHKIFKAAHRPCALEMLRENLEHLEELVEGPSDEIIGFLQKLVPEYVPDWSSSVATKENLVTSPAENPAVLWNGVDVDALCAYQS